MTDRNTTIDSLRGVAALAVLATHAAWALSPATAPLIGPFGVGLFFLASGYVVAPAIERAGARSFLWRRAWRLLPLFWVSVAVALVCYALVPGAAAVLSDDPAGITEALARAPLWAIAAHLPMAPDLLGVPRLQGAYWTLAYELLCYALALLFRRVPGPLAGAASAVALLGALGGWHAPFPVACFCCGLALARAPRWATVALLLAAAAAWLGADLAMDTRLARLFPLALFPLALRVAWTWRPLAWLGTLSYGVYLLHMPVLLVLPPPLWLPGSIGAAWIAARLVERPAIQLGRRLGRLPRTGEIRQRAVAVDGACAARVVENGELDVIGRTV